MDEEITFDFGFTTANEEEIFAPIAKETQKAVELAKSDITAVQEKLDHLYNTIQPLLQNLKANPEKEYILWPGRVEKVEQFEALLKGIYEGK